MPVLDGTAIAVSVFRGDFATASSVMFLLGIGEILEDWTHKKSVGDLARSMSLNVSKVWLVTEEGREVLVDANTITAGDRIVVHMGNVIPFDGKVSAGEGAVNQSSLTGEGLPVMKAAGGFVYAGKFLEKVAQADTIVFDKTGTLTKAQPTVVDVVSFNGQPSDELLRTAACLEEHFPHSMAKAVVNAALEKGLAHEEKHSKVEYIVAHGISSSVDDSKVVIGSHHFVFEDEQCTIPAGMQERFDRLRNDCSHLYMAIDGQLAAVICIEDPLREEAADVIRQLRSLGLTKLVMMTGDSDRTARTIAAKVGVDEYYSEVLPEDKASFVEKEKAQGRNVIMIGDGINDSPALSAADVGIAVSDGAEIAREIADITIGADDLSEIVTLKEISNALMKRIHGNYRKIVGINSGLIILGVLGLIQPTTSALLHNTSTLVISLESMKNLVEEK